MYRLRERVATLSAVALIAGAVLSACGGGGDASPTHNDADAVFIAMMTAHHARAIEVGQLAADKGSDARVRDFGKLIVSQQSPELDRLRGWSKDIPAPAQSGMSVPDGYIDDAALSRLRSESGVVFDRDVLLASASSETGAAAMSQRELASGVYDPARTLATSIASAPTTQIPQLRELAAALGG